LHSFLLAGGVGAAGVGTGRGGVGGGGGVGRGGGGDGGAEPEQMSRTCPTAILSSWQEHPSVCSMCSISVENCSAMLQQLSWSTTL
jgi:hypothetical protein